MPEEALYASHLATVQSHHAVALQRSEADVVIVDAGEHGYHFRDDQAQTFRSNPLLNHWLPLIDQESHVLIWRPGNRPVLLYFQPADYWHLPPAAPAGEWVQHFDIRIVSSPEALQSAIAELAGGRAVYLGTRPALLTTLGRSTNHAALINPSVALDYLEYQRACKTAYELDCMRQATVKAVRGHRAAAAEFARGGSEYSIHLAYLQASQQTERDLPYGNIVALNEHAGVLHYQHQAHTQPQRRHSFLIDAGARHAGYAADVTRTYANAPGLFADLVQGLDDAQRRLIDGIRLDMPYLELHEQAQRMTAELLCAKRVLRCAADEAYAQGLTRVFLPHGLGHLLGLQTHDVGGHMADDKGGTAPPPEHYPSLRNTRTVAQGQVFTIEPGIYFIPMLLDPLRAQNDVRFDWKAIDALLPCGGIRIEDNVHVLADGVENLTRDAFAASAHI